MKKFFSLLFVATALISCSDDDDDNKNANLTEQLFAKSWKVKEVDMSASYETPKGIDKLNKESLSTVDFTEYSLSFGTKDSLITKTVLKTVDIIQGIGEYKLIDEKKFSVKLVDPLLKDKPFNQASFTEWASIMKEDVIYTYEVVSLGSSTKIKTTVTSYADLPKGVLEKLVGVSEKGFKEYVITISLTEETAAAK